MLTSNQMSFSRPQRTLLERITALIIGWFLVTLGILGWILPILPGWIFFAAGILVLSSEYVWAHKLVQRVRIRFPKFGASLDRAIHHAEAKASRIFHRKSGGSEAA